jgi:ribosomal subunit interface protein
MHMTVKGHHIDITDSIRSYVDQKFGRPWRHFDHVNEVHVVLSVQKLNQIRKGCPLRGEPRRPVRRYRLTGRQTGSAGRPVQGDASAWGAPGPGD